MTRAAALLLLEFLGGARNFGTRQLRLGTGTTGVAESNDDLMHQITIEFATEDRVGNRQGLGATYY